MGTKYFNTAKWVSDKYVIFSDTTNPYANKVSARMGNENQLNKELAELSSVLSKLANAERTKETNYIINKLALLPEDSDLQSQIITILNQDGSGKLSAIINLLIKRKQALEELVKNYDKDRGALKSSGVYGRKFGDYLAEQLKKDFVENKRGGGWSNLGITKTIDDYINAFLEEKVFNNTAVNKRWNLYKEIFNRLKSSFQKNAPKGWYDENTGLFAPINQQLLQTTINNHGSGKTVRQQIDSIINNVLLGIPLEYNIAGEFMDTKLHIKKQDVAAVGIKEGKADVEVIDRARATITISDEMDMEAIDNLMKKMKIEADQLQTAVGPNGWLLAISAKDYGSLNNIQIGSGNLRLIDQRLQKNIEKMGISSGNLNAIIFNIANGVETGQLEAAKEQLAQIAAAWMFDDIEQMFRANGTDGTIHIYNINGYYMLLSDLLLEASNTIFSATRGSGLVNIEVEPWLGGREVWETKRKEKSSIKTNTTYPTEPIWNEVKNLMAEKTWVKIAFDYKTIFNFANSLRALLRKTI